MHLLSKQSFVVFLTTIIIFSAKAQKNSNTSTVATKTNSGVSVSPAHLHLDLKQGQSKVYAITINNDTPTKKSFNINMQDFNMDGKGKSSFLPAGKGLYSLSKWSSITPTFVELKPYEKRKIDFKVSIPNTNEGRKAAWSIIMVELQEARKNLEPKNKNSNTDAFGIFAYQNPPNVEMNNVEWVNVKFGENKKIKKKTLLFPQKTKETVLAIAHLTLTLLT
jgi:hypothetical protein